MDHYTVLQGVLDLLLSLFLVFVIFGLIDRYR